MLALNTMIIDFKPATRAEFRYHMTTTISITGKGRLSVSKNSRSGFAQNRMLASSADHQIQDHGPTGPGRLALRAVGRQNGNLFSIELNETDKAKAMRALLFRCFSVRLKRPPTAK
jgi:hypothetical protein